MRGNGFSAQVPEGWHVSTTSTGVVARSGEALVSVTRFPLRKAYDQSQFAAVETTLDGVAARLAKAAGTSIGKAETVTVAGRKARAYSYGTKRIGFVLAGSEEYQLFCAPEVGDACSLLFSSFTLTG